MSKELVQFSEANVPVNLFQAHIPATWPVIWIKKKCSFRKQMLIIYHIGIM